MRLKNGDVRDHIVSSKIDQGPRSGVAKQRSSREVKRSTFARFLGSFDFRLLQHYHLESRHRLSSLLRLTIEPCRASQNLRPLDGCVRPHYSWRARSPEGPKVH